MRSMRKTLRGVFSIKRHRIMRIDYYILESAPEDSQFELVSAANESELFEGVYSVKNQWKLLCKNRGCCEAYVLKQNGKPIGTVSIAYPGSNELEYRIRSIESFIYNLAIEETQRERGYSRLMLLLLAEKMKNKKIRYGYLAVSTDNKKAINAYLNSGFVDIERKSFVRLLRMNIPYYKL